MESSAESSLRFNYLAQKTTAARGDHGMIIKLSENFANDTETKQKVRQHDFTILYSDETPCAHVSQ